MNTEIMQIKTSIYRAFLPFFLFFVVPGVYAQRVYPFVPNEEMDFAAYYNWGPVWIYAGDATLTSDSTTYKHKRAVKLSAVAHSLKKWDFIFSLKDNYKAIADMDGFRPLFYEKKTMEGGYWIHNIYRFDWGQKWLNVFTESKRFPKKDTTYRLNHPLYDVLTATYYLRTLDLSKISVGDTFDIPVISDGVFDTYHIVYAGIGAMAYRKDKIPCHIYKAVLTSSTFFSRKDPLSVYVTADAKRLPIYVEANIIVGSIKIYLIPYQEYKPKKNQSN